MLLHARAHWHHALPQWARQRLCSDSSVRRVVTKLLVAEGQAVETEALRAVWATSRPELAEMQIRHWCQRWGGRLRQTLAQRPVWYYTVVGDHMNVATRRESVSRVGEVCISEAT